MDKCDCGGVGHKFKDGKWVRCLCVKDEQRMHVLVAAGVDARYVDARIAHLKAKLLPKQYALLKSWALTLRSKLKERESCIGSWVVLSSGCCRIFVGAVARMVWECSNTIRVYCLQDTLMRISDSVLRPKIYQEMCSYDVVIFEFLISGVNEKAMGFITSFMGAVLKTRQRQGKATVVLSEGDGVDFKRAVGKDFMSVLLDFEKVI